MSWSSSSAFSTCLLLLNCRGLLLINAYLSMSEVRVLTSSCRLLDYLPDRKSTPRRWSGAWTALSLEASVFKDSRRQWMWHFNVSCLLRFHVFSEASLHFSALFFARESRDCFLQCLEIDASLNIIPDVSKQNSSLLCASQRAFF